MSPDVRKVVNGHQEAVGQAEPSSPGWQPIDCIAPQWQFSVAYVLPVAAKPFSDFLPFFPLPLEAPSFVFP